MQEQVVPTVVKLFANTDRSMRIPLLERLPTSSSTSPPRDPHPSPSPSPSPSPHKPLTPRARTPQVVNESLFSNVAMGFVDTSPALPSSPSRAWTCAQAQAPSMQQVMRAFAKLQMDEEAAIAPTPPSASARSPARPPTLKA